MAITQETVTIVACDYPNCPNTALYPNGLATDNSSSGFNNTVGDSQHPGDRPAITVCRRNNPISQEK